LAVAGGVSHKSPAPAVELSSGRQIKHLFTMNYDTKEYIPGLIFIAIAVAITFILSAL
jgi:hypothetical protein